GAGYARLRQYVGVACRSDIARYEVAVDVGVVACADGAAHVADRRDIHVAESAGNVGGDRAQHQDVDLFVGGYGSAQTSASEHRGIVPGVDSTRYIPGQSSHVGVVLS